mgnify:CR=1 FL=1
MGERALRCAVVGGAMLAMVGTGLYASVKDCADAMVQIKETIYPDPALAAVYEQRYQQFRRIYPSVKPLYKGFKEFQEEPLC